MTVFKPQSTPAHLPTSVLIGGFPPRSFGRLEFAAEVWRLGSGRIFAIVTETDGRMSTAADAAPAVAAVHRGAPEAWVLLHWINGRYPAGASLGAIGYFTDASVEQAPDLARLADEGFDLR